MRHVCGPTHDFRACGFNMAKGRRNSQKKKKSNKGTDEGETEIDDEGEDKNNVLVIPFGCLFSRFIMIRLRRENRGINL